MKIGITGVPPPSSIALMAMWRYKGCRIAAKALIKSKKTILISIKNISVMENSSKKPGLIVNDGIFYNPDHIIKMNKYDNQSLHWIEILMTNGNKSTLSFETQEDRDKSFREIIKRLYGECAVFDYQKGKYIY